MYSLALFLNSSSDPLSNGETVTSDAPPPLFVKIIPERTALAASAPKITAESRPPIIPPPLPLPIELKKRTMLINEMIPKMRSGGTLTCLEVVTPAIDPMGMDRSSYPMGMAPNKVFRYLIAIRRFVTTMVVGNQNRSRLDQNLRENTPCSPGVSIISLSAMWLSIPDIKSGAQL